MTEGSRRRVTYAQLDTLWEFLNDHRDIATGYNKSARARDNSKKMWETIAASLNAHGDGAVKDWKGWSKYWNDYKSKLKRNVAAIRSSLTRTGGGPSDAPTLSEVEQKFLQILGDTFGSGLPGIRVEPFNQEPEIMETQTQNNENETEASLEVETGTPILLEYIQQDQPQDQARSPQPGPSTRAVTPRPILRTPTQSPRPSPRRSPRARIPARQRAGSPPQRHRRRRREPPMSQESARRALIEIAREGNESLRAGLQEIKNELKAVKELLQARLPVPELPPTPNLNLS